MDAHLPKHAEWSIRVRPPRRAPERRRRGRRMEIVRREPGSIVLTQLDPVCRIWTNTRLATVRRCVDWPAILVPVLATMLWTYIAYVLLNGLGWLP